MNTSQDFNQLYRDVSENMASAMSDLVDLKVDNKEGQERLSSITAKLREIQSGFDEELEFLETNAEWEKFTMAFFGETNAGKSTIIESLRILFNEQSRRELIDANNGDLEPLAEQVHAHAERVQKLLTQVYRKHAKEVADIRHGCGQLAQILSDEVAERSNLAEQQAAENVRVAKHEAAERLKIAEKTASGRLRRHLIVGGCFGILLGASLSSAAFWVLGG